MLSSPWFIVILTLIYVLLLFAIASFADKNKYTKQLTSINRWVYPLALAVYCTSWTFFGAVGTAVKSGWDYLPIYLGPVLVMIFGFQILKRIITISKTYRITSIADFIAFRYGRDRLLAVLVTIASVIGSIPYIALQLKAITDSFMIITDFHGTQDALSSPVTALIITLLLALFAVLFGTRDLDASEHHRGMMWSIAFGSVIKLFAFIAIGLFVIFEVLDGPTHFINLMNHDLQTNPRFTNWQLGNSFLINTFIAMTALICLPRQFHVAIVENRSIQELHTARWAFPLYLLIFSFFVLPISLAGLLLFSANQVNPDNYTLAIPLSQNKDWLATFTFIGGFSAASSMVIVSTVALATMISNDLVMPLLLRSQFRSHHDLSRILLMVRRVSIPVIAIIAYIYYLQTQHDQSLQSIGLLSFSAVAHFAPPLIIGLYWQRVGRIAARSGLIVGFIAWFLMLFIPSIANIHQPLTDIAQLPLLQELMHRLAYSDFSSRVGISLLLNTLTIIFVSLLNMSNKPTHSNVSPSGNQLHQIDEGLIKLNELKAVISPFIGKQRTQSAYKSFLGHVDDDTEEQLATPALIQFTERLLAGSIGTASARTVLMVALQKQGLGANAVLDLLDQTSRAVRFNRRILEATLNNIIEAVTVIDGDLRVIGWNQRFEHLYKFPKGMPYHGQPIEELLQHIGEHGYLGGKNPQGRIDRRMQQMRDGEFYRFLRNWPDGRVIEIHGIPMSTGGYLNTFTDITEYKHTERALRESEQSVRLYTDNAPSMLSYTDSNMVIRFANRAYTQFHGKQAAEIVNQSVKSVFNERDYARRIPFILNVLDGKRQEYEDEFLSHDGQRVYLLIIYIPDIDENQNVRGFFSVQQDISRRRQAELAVEESNILLEQRVFERTSELEHINTQLINAREQAEAANKSKTRFLAAASHDLLQPMNAARLFVSVLQQKRIQLIDSQKELVDRIDTSLSAAEELLIGLLDVSKLDSGYIQPKLETISIKSLFTKLGNQFGPLCDDKNIQLRIRACDVWVQSDPQMLQRILQNLLANAVRYTPSGGILLSARERGTDIEVAVWDTGIGIPVDDQGSIFAEFHRLQTAKNIDQTGLGLGLSISQRMADMLNHQLKLKSQVNKGSCFSLLMPQVLAHKTPLHTQPILTNSSNPLAGIKVLCIDNETDILDGMKALLQGWQCDVYTAVDQESAFSHLNEQQHFDFILADYHLSDGRNGLDLANDIQKQLDTSAKTIVISAERSPILESKVHDCNASLLRKPIKPAALRSLMSNLLRESQQTP